jgi:hypothetical protein
MFNNDNSSPVLTNVTISNNTSTGTGGGMYNTNTSSPALANVTISGNYADSGGGMHNAASSPVLTNVILSGNFASSNGGGMSSGNSSSPMLTNVTIAGNYAGNYAGGMYIQSGSPKIRNSVIWGNTASTAPGIVDSTGMGTIAYSIVQGSSYTATPDGNGNMKIDPLFVAEDLAAPGDPTTGGDYRLKNGTGDAEGNVISPAINVGNSTLYPITWALWQNLIGASVITNDVYNEYVLPALAKDLGGNTRLIGAIDMGAYERQ